eukprot:11398481-Karenia_brevis.AAC.1
MMKQINLMRIVLMSCLLAELQGLDMLRISTPRGLASWRLGVPTTVDVLRVRAAQVQPACWLNAPGWMFSKYLPSSRLLRVIGQLVSETSKLKNSGGRIVSKYPPPGV